MFSEGQQFECINTYLISYFSDLFAYMNTICRTLCKSLDPPLNLKKKFLQKNASTDLLKHSLVFLRQGSLSNCVSILTFL